MTRDELAIQYIADEPKLIARASRMYSNRFSDDELHDIYSSCWESIERMTFIQRLPAFFWVVFHNRIRNTSRNEFRSLDALDHVPEDTSEDAYLMECEDTRGDEAREKELIDWRVNEAMSRVSPDLAAIGWSIYATGKSCKDLGAEMNLSVSAMKRRLRQFKAEFTPIYLSLREEEPSCSQLPESAR